MTSPNPRQNLHGPRQLKSSRVNRGPRPKQEVSGPRSFRPEICLFSMQSNSIFLDVVTWPPCRNGALCFSALDRRATVRLIPDRLLPQYSWIFPIPILDLTYLRGSATPTKRPVSKFLAPFGKASSDSNGSVCMTSGAQEVENSLLPPSEYDRLAPTQVPRDQ